MGHTHISSVLFCHSLVQVWSEEEAGARPCASHPRTTMCDHHVRCLWGFLDGLQVSYSGWLDKIQLCLHCRS
ncbi:hypothetical protein BDA96_08G145700 [Sorghum bicolor]|uniref:Secreted protein n=1 Tax=Sorghum bicolor TaxID=4558 RepID=A0A921QGC5_SORBI|nr:hypothetical protein BDA96_08G145700 [Sorghum bicolor]